MDPSPTPSATRLPHDPLLYGTAVPCVNHAHYTYVNRTHIPASTRFARHVTRTGVAVTPLCGSSFRVTIAAKERSETDEQQSLSRE